MADVSGILLPVSDGNYIQWTPKTGSTHYAMVDESSCNGATDYNRTTTVGDRDSYGISLASVPDGATITQIDIKPCASRNNSGGGSSTMNVFYRANGVDSADAGNYSLTGTTPLELSTTTFSGLSLVKGSGSALEVGAVLSAGTKGARLSRIVTVVIYTPLTVPSSLNAVTVSQSQINLSWTDGSSNEDGFKIERSTAGAGGPWTQISTTTADVVLYSDNGLLSNTTYWYQVRAYNSGGNSNYSNVGSATTLPDAPAVTTVSASSVTSSSAILNGFANPNGAATTGWFRYSSTDPGACDDVFGTRAPFSGGTNLGSGTSTVNYSRSVSGLSDNTTYYYCAIASNSGGTGFGSIVSFTTPQALPNAPSNLTGTASSSDVVLNWSDNSSNEDGFNVWRSADGSSFSSVATTTANVITYTEIGLGAGTWYHKVRAFKGAGYSGFSNIATTTNP